jgi:hypothetical protein
VHCQFRLRRLIEHANPYIAPSLAAIGGRFRLDM